MHRLERAFCSAWNKQKYFQKLFQIEVPTMCLGLYRMSDNSSFPEAVSFWGRHGNNGRNGTWWKDFREILNWSALLPIFVEILGTWISLNPLLQKKHFTNCTQVLLLDVQIAVLGHSSILLYVCTHDDFSSGKQWEKRFLFMCWI